MNNLNQFFYPTNNDYELSLFLFTKCNLNCDFCHEQHTNDIDIEAIKNIPKLLEDNYPEELKSVNNTMIEIEGGELFSDDISDSMFEIYHDLINNIIGLIKSHNKNIKIDLHLLSNGVNTKYYRIIKLFNLIQIHKDLKITLRLSYDPIGRFKTKEQFEMFKNTFWYFYNNNIIPEISTVLTKKNIDIIINNKDEFINSIPKDVSLDMCYYVNNDTNKNTVDDYLPSDDDLFNFYKWGIDNDKFNIRKLLSLLSIYQQKKELKYSCSCRRMLIYYDKKIFKTLYEKGSPYNPGIIENGFNQSPITSNELVELYCFPGIERRGCLYCEYNNICNKRCWCSILYNNYKMKECFIKRTIQYLYEHPGIKDRYIKFMEIIKNE